MINVVEVARTALFLPGKASRSIVGEVLGVDGGWRLNGAQQAGGFSWWY
jgi:enoyl-[acyl-carrier-protein] reductase (NADH)